MAIPVDKLPSSAATTIASRYEGDVKLYVVEILSTKKQVVLPPSRHPETLKEYVWLDGMPDSLPLVPESLLSTPVVQGVTTTCKRGCGSGTALSGRNDYLFSHAAQWLREGLDPAKLAECLHNLNRKVFDTPLGDAEVDGIIKSAIRRRQ